MSVPEWIATMTEEDKRWVENAADILRLAGRTAESAAAATAARSSSFPLIKAPPAPRPNWIATLTPEQMQEVERTAEADRLARRAAVEEDRRILQMVQPTVIAERVAPVITLQSEAEREFLETGWEEPSEERLEEPARTRTPPMFDRPRIPIATPPMPGPDRLVWIRKKDFTELKGDFHFSHHCRGCLGDDGKRVEVVECRLGNLRNQQPCHLCTAYELNPKDFSQHLIRVFGDTPY
jgi:hypothetical protein